MARHSKKEVQNAIDYALERGWSFEKAGPRAHSYGVLYCLLRTREGCRISVFSTPRSAENHANYIRGEIDRCPHVGRPE